MPRFRGHPINVTIHPLRAPHPTVKCHATEAVVAVRTALGKCRDEQLLPQGCQILGIDVTGTQPGDPISAEDFRQAVRDYGFVWRDK
jgi:hypothetical protein